MRRRRRWKSRRHDEVQNRTSGGDCDLPVLLLLLLQDWLRRLQLLLPL